MLINGFILLIATICYVEAVDYSGYRLVRFTADEKVTKWLEELEQHSYDLDKDTGSQRVLLDVWDAPSAQSSDADVLVAPEFLPVFLDLLKVKGVQDVNTVIENVENQFLRERRDIDSRRHRVKRSLAQSHFDLENYHPYSEMVSYMKNLAKDYPNLVKLHNLTNTFEGRPLYAVQISKDSSFRPAIFLDAGVHAREWAAPAAALYIIDKLVKGYGNDPKVTRSLNKFDWFIVPQANPDGYEYSRSTDRLWRKTRSHNSTKNKWCYGADANRNWGYRWGEVGTTRHACSNIYAGSHPFSEPEIVGIKDFITWQIPQLMVYVSLHSYGQLLLYPWGYTKDKPENYVDQKNAARAAVAAMKNATGATYSYGTIAEIMYPASGTSIDYMQHKGIPYIYGVELRPLDGPNSFAFNLPPKFIKPTGEEMLAGLLAIGDYAVIHKRL